jgi:hypothetical protein
MTQDRKSWRYRDKTVDARPSSLRDSGHIGFSGVGVKKNRKQLVLFEPRDFLESENHQQRKPLSYCRPSGEFTSCRFFKPTER